MRIWTRKRQTETANGKRQMVNGNAGAVGHTAPEDDLDYLAYLSASPAAYRYDFSRQVPVNPEP